MGIFINPNILYINRKLVKQRFQKKHFEMLYIQIAQGLMQKHLTQALVKNAPSREKISHC
jgi:disulfide oxidoreductase YuzD